MTVTDVLADLVAEQRALDALVADLDDEHWRLPTPSPRWSVADQIGHLAYFDAAAATAVTDPERFEALAAELLAGDIDGEEAVDELTLGRYRALTPTELLAAWRADRAALEAAGESLGEHDRVTWYGPSMGSKSFLTARLMECWAHGEDVAAALGVERDPTDRLHHVARLGFLTRTWSYLNRGLDAPTTEVRVRLRAPSGAEWSFGPEDAPESVEGAAVDFCRVVTQRRHVDDTALVATDGAREWLVIAQAFAGPPTDGPEPGNG